MNIPVRKLLAECFGTFCLVFAGTGAIVVDGASGGAVTHLGVALTFGLVVMAMIYALGDISGAHLNPAVTAGFYAAGRLDGADLVPYMSGQLAGAIAASGMMHMLFPRDRTLGFTRPAGSVWQSLILETVLTLILMFVILSVSTGAKEKGITAGIAVGSVIGLEALFAGPICGASMNPARSIGPALVSGHIENLWAYIAGPMMGAVLAVPLCCGIRGGSCCGPRTSSPAGP